jgi:hypothetical protein
MADLIVDLPNGNTLVTVDLSEWPMPIPHPPDPAGVAILSPTSVLAAATVEAAPSGEGAAP